MIYLFTHITLINYVLKVVQLKNNDIEAILKLEKRNPCPKLFYSRTNDKTLDYIFQNADKCKALGLFDQQLIAWGSYISGRKDENLNKDTFEINSIFVDKAYRNKGIATLLLNTMIADIKNNYKNPKIYLTVYPLNINALRLYLSNGFYIKKFKRDVYGPNADRVYLYLKDPASNQIYK